MIDNTHKKVVFKSALPEVLSASKCRVKLLVGAGDIGVEVSSLTKILNDEA